VHLILFASVDGIVTDVQNRKKFNDEKKVTMEAICVSNKGFLFEILQEYEGTPTNFG
jgi:hypothetical protein